MSKPALHWVFMEDDRSMAQLGPYTLTVWREDGGWSGEYDDGYSGFTVAVFPSVDEARVSAELALAAELGLLQAALEFGEA